MNIFPLIKLETLLLCLLCLDKIKVSSSFETNLRQFKWKRLLKEISGSQIRVSAGNIPPFMSMVKMKNETYRFQGSAVEVLEWLAASLNFTLTFIPVSDSEDAKYGTVQASINQLLRDEVDIVSAGTVPTPDRSKVMDFSIPLVITQFRFMVPWPEEESRLLVPIHPFQSKVWISIAITLIVMVPALAIISGLHQKAKINNLLQSATHNLSLSDHAVYVASVLLSQGHYFPWKQTSFRVAAGIWCLMALVLINAYAGNLFSHMTVPKLQPVVQSFEDLASSSDLKLAVEANSIIANRMLVSEYLTDNYPIAQDASSGPEKILGDSLRHDINSLITSRAAGLKMLFTLKYAYVGIDPIISVLIGATYDKNSLKCRFTASNHLPAYQFFGYAYQKGGLYNKLMDNRLQILIDMGLINYWIKKTTPNIDQCLLKNQKTTTRRPSSLNLYGLSFAFFVLGVGIGISLLVFLLEKIMFLAVGRRGRRGKYLPKSSR